MPLTSEAGAPDWPPEDKTMRKATEELWQGLRVHQDDIPPELERLASLAM